MDLIALYCRGCGAQLNFSDNSSFCSCGFCGVQHVLTDIGGSEMQLPVSFVPYTPAKNGVMELSLKLQMVRNLRKYSEYIFSDGNAFRESDFDLNETTGKAEYKYAVRACAEEPFQISRVEKVACNNGSHSSRQDIREEYKVIHMLLVHTIPVTVKRGAHKLLIGHRVQIGVNYEEYEEIAMEVSKILHDNFDVIPEIVLLKG